MDPKRKTLLERNASCYDEKVMSREERLFNYEILPFFMKTAFSKARRMSFE